MKRDLNLMRQIMLDLEEFPYIQNNISELWPNKSLEEYQLLAMHIRLLADNNYLELGSCLLGYEFENWYITRITNDGHTFLDYIRSDTLWNKIYPKLITIGSIALKFLIPIATKYLPEL